jgi:hypothetical protein
MHFGFPNMLCYDSTIFIFYMNTAINVFYNIFFLAKKLNFVDRTIAGENILFM